MSPDVAQRWQGLRAAVGDADGVELDLEPADGFSEDIGATVARAALARSGRDRRDLPDAFVIGYGLDYSERWRNLPYIATLELG